MTMLRFGAGVPLGALWFAALVLPVTLTATVTLTGAASAQSGSPAVVPQRLGALFGQEQAALGAVKPGHVARILGDAAPARTSSAPSRRFDAGDVACLAEALYHEARGEGRAGMIAVAEVVLNRVESPRFPATICGVVRQGADNPAGCQFSFVCDGSLEAAREPRAWARAAELARDMATRAPRDLTEGATHFHALRVRPHWAQVYRMTAEIGAHRFYRKPAQLAAN
jgi:spore germination cell wall hydrolase CwlJ-like protein